MAPTLICVRHAQGFHNLGTQYHTLRDPKLTPLGEQQCLNLKQNSFFDQSHISSVVASPLSRTIHTAFATFQPALTNGKTSGQILAIPDLQETSTLACDTGSDIDTLKQKCEEHQWPVDLSLLHPSWTIKASGTRYASSGRAVDSRARDARRFVRQNMRDLVKAGDSDVQVVLVSHGGYLHYFTQDWENATKHLGTGWNNCEARAYVFTDGIDSDDTNASLEETDLSRKTRGINRPRLSAQEQLQTLHHTIQTWVGLGLDGLDDLDGEGTASGQEAVVDSAEPTLSNGVKASI